MYVAKHYHSMHAGERNPACTSAVHAQMSTKLEVSYPGQMQKAWLDKPWKLDLHFKYVKGQGNTVNRISKL